MIFILIPITKHKSLNRQPRNTVKEVVITNTEFLVSTIKNVATSANSQYFNKEINYSKFAPTYKILFKITKV